MSPDSEHEKSKLGSDMPITGLEKWGIRRLYLWAVSYAKRYATLEARIAALEELLKTCPAEGCPYCGVRAMRLEKQNRMVRGDSPNLWRDDEWKCGACGKITVKHIPVGKK